jgi:pimeloyl-ACP methyl ester carboxylesterase
MRTAQFLRRKKYVQLILIRFVVQIKENVLAMKKKFLPISVLLAAVLSMFVLLGSTPPSTRSASVSTSTPSTLKWHSCSPTSPPVLQCAELQVPLDYSHPQGAKITLGLDRLKAEDPQHRIGSLVFNPGGPGGSGVAIVALEALGKHLFTSTVRTSFDLIGMDPRGVGRSTPIKCDPQIWNESVSLFPRDEASFQKLVAHNKALGESCLRLTGPLFEHVDTVSAARDIEQVRIALGEGKLNYLGLSYGTQLGAIYAELYPKNIRVMALDGNLDHSLPETANMVTEATSYEDELNRFASWCNQTTTCALHGQDVLQVFDRLVRQADAKPIPAPRCAGQCRSTVTGEDVRFNVQGHLLFKEPLPSLDFSGWAGLATDIVDALAGDASTLSTGIASKTDDNVFPALAIECLDWPVQSTSYQDIAYKEMLGQVVAPHTQGASQTWSVQTGCIGWPVPVQNPPHSADVHGAPPILLINATHDPSTSYTWANGLLNQISGSVLLTREGDGHTSYYLSGHSRTTDAIDHYLVTGITPPPNTVYPD